MSVSYRPEIDGLRAVAVGIVVLFHAGVEALSGGFVGVDVFFVISGYLISQIVWSDCQAGRFSLRRFYARRVRRILPALCLVLMVSLGVGCGMLFASELVALARSAVAALLFVPNLYYWQTTGYFEIDAASTPLLHTWSLGVEEQFYLFFPLALYLIYRRAPRYLSALIGLGVLASFVSALWATSAHPVFSFYQLPTRAWELMLGATLGLSLVASPKSAVLSELAAGGGLLMIIAAALLIDEHQPFPGFLALWPCLGSWLFIWASRQRATCAGRLLASRPFVLIGLGSYSLYLWHWPVVVYIDMLRPGAGLVLFKIVLALTLTWISYRFVERPFRYGLSARRSLLSIATWAALLLGFSLLLIQTQGLPARVPPEVAELAESSRLRPQATECHGRAMAAIRDDRGCRLGLRAGEPQFVLLGDSHADALSPALHEAATSLGLTGLQMTAPGCAPLRHLVRTTLPRCGAWLEEAIDNIQGMPEVEVVLLAAYWRPYLQGHSHRYRNFELRAEGSLVFAEDRLVAVGSALERTAAALAGRRLIFVRDVPEIGASFGANVVRNWARRKWLALGGAEPPSHRLSPDTYTAQMEQLLAQFGSRFEVLDPAQRLCDGERCPLLLQGKLLYRDGDHISPYAAQQLAPDFAPLLSSAP